MSEIEATNDVAALTVQLLSAYLANNTVSSEDIAGLIRSTRDALTGAPSVKVEAKPETFTAAVSTRKSLASPEHIISLIDGKPYKTLKRHLQSRGLTPDDYRSRYNLPASYPMVAPEYSSRRRAVAQEFGLGGKRAAADAATAGSGADASSENMDAQAALAPSAAPKTKQAPASVAKTKSRKRAANSISYTAVTHSPASSANTDDIPDAATVSESTQTESPLATKNAAQPANKKEARTSVRANAAERTRDKSEAKARSDSAPKPMAEDTGAPENIAADDQTAEAARKTNRRAKLGVFKKSDNERADVRDPLADASIAEMPTKPKRRTRMARETHTSQSDRANGSTASEKVVESNKPKFRSGGRWA